MLVGIKALLPPGPTSARLGQHLSSWAQLLLLFFVAFVAFFFSLHVLEPSHLFSASSPPPHLALGPGPPLRLLWLQPLAAGGRGLRRAGSLGGAAGRAPPLAAPPRPRPRRGCHGTWLGAARGLRGGGGGRLRGAKGAVVGSPPRRRCREEEEARAQGSHPGTSAAATRPAPLVI